MVGNIPAAGQQQRGAARRLFPVGADDSLQPHRRKRRFVVYIIMSSVPDQHTSVHTTAPSPLLHAAGGRIMLSGVAHRKNLWYDTLVCGGIEVVITGLTRNFWKLRPFCPLKRSAAQGFARVRISQFHIVLARFSCILPEQGLHLRYTESCPRGRRCDTRNHVISSKK